MDLELSYRRSNQMGSSILWPTLVAPCQSQKRGTPSLIWRHWLWSGPSATFSTISMVTMSRYVPTIKPSRPYLAARMLLGSMHVGGARYIARASTLLTSHTDQARRTPMQMLYLNNPASHPLRTHCQSLCTGGFDSCRSRGCHDAADPTSI